MISSILGSPTWKLPCYLVYKNQREQLTSLRAISVLIEELSVSENFSSGANEILQRVINSTDNLATILAIRKDGSEDVFSHKSSFIENEQNLLVGHRQQPDPKSREGFSRNEFVKYSPETNGKMQLHFMYVNKAIVATESLLEKSVDELFLSFVRDVDLPAKPSEDYELFVAHPWQANYLDKLKEIREYKGQNKIIDIGVVGPWFYPTTSVRTVYSPELNIMLKFSLNVAITNSVRVNLAKECKRSIAVYKLYKGQLGTVLKNKFPYFGLIADPAYTAIKANDKIIDSSICIIREANFNSEEDIACIASLTEPDPFSGKTRISSLVEYLGEQNRLSYKEAACCWFEAYLDIAIAPVLWLYCQSGIALEAHQQNSLIKLEDGLPTESFYRDSQGYYYIENHINQKIFGDIGDLCVGTEEFVDHHFSYYFLVNHLIAVIEAITNTSYLEEQIFVEIFVNFITEFAIKNQTNDRFCKKILSQDLLPLKANLLTRLHGLDELQAPLISQSIYVNIKNPFKANYENL
jgi:siderophore synthetase component